MFRNLLSATIFLLSVASIPAVARAAAPFELKPVKIELPDSDKMFPAGPGADQINSNCLACHSADMVLNQPGLPKATWDAEVHKMINSYKAPVDEADVAAIVAYLVKNKGVHTPRQ